MRPRGLRAGWRWGNRIRTYAFHPNEPARRQEREAAVEYDLITGGVMVPAIPDEPPQARTPM